MRVDHPGEKWGDHVTPQKCRGPTKGPWDIRARERGSEGRLVRGEIGEDMKECISKGEIDWDGEMRETIERGGGERKEAGDTGTL